MSPYYLALLSMIYRSTEQSQNQLFPLIVFPNNLPPHGTNQNQVSTNYNFSKMSCNSTNLKRHFMTSGDFPSRALSQTRRYLYNIG